MLRHKIRIRNVPYCSTLHSLCKPVEPYDFYIRSYTVSFSSLPFLFYFLPAFLAVYSVVPSRWRNGVLALGSLLFYFTGAGAAGTLVLLGLLLVNYAAARLLDRAQGRARKGIFLFALVCDLGSLFYFKYMGWILTDVGKLFHADLSFLHTALPLGLSFYVFQSAAYLIDVYRGDERPEHSLIDYTAFQAMFPQLTMGPILRLHDVKDALHAPRRPRRAELEAGFSLFVAGLGCKVIVADQLAPLWSSLERIGFAYLSTPLAWFGAVGYSLQLYFDFSGYSLMAMGLGQMLGFSIPRNFDLPYCSRSISEFWRRWHITLGTWFRDYLYIPLGGSRQGRRRLFLSLFAVWTLTGLWHGAAWNFVLWGFVLFLLIALEKFVIGGFLNRHRILSHLYFLFLIPQTWVIFRISDLSELGAYFSRLYPFFSSGDAVFSGDFFRQAEHYWWLFALGFLLAAPWPRRFYEKYRATPLVWLPLFAVFWLCLFLIATGTGNPFLYARF